MLQKHKVYIIVKRVAELQCNNKGDFSHAHHHHLTASETLIWPHIYHFPEDFFCHISLEFKTALPTPPPFFPFFFLSFSLKHKNLVPASFLQCIPLFPPKDYLLASQLKYCPRPFPPTACSEMNPVPALLRSTILLIYSSHPISYQ